MSHTDKIASALSLIEEHNKALDPTDEKVDENKFQKELKKLGGTTDASLRESSWEDLEDCGLPRILARKVATIFRADSKPVETDPQFVSEKHALKMNPLYLLQAYNRNDPSSPVYKRLLELSRGQSFVVFTRTGAVNTQASFRILDNEIMRGRTGRNFVDVDGETFRCYSIGDGPGELVDEDPLFPNTPLRSDGTSDRVGRSWDGVSHFSRQIIYLATTKTGEINGITTEKAHDILDIAQSAGADAKIRQRYRKASVLLNELTDLNLAPTLKIKLGKNGLASSRTNDPFFAAHKTY